MVGSSNDSVEQHGKFKAKYQLPSTLITDEEGTLFEAYDVWRKKKLYGKGYVEIVRSTNLINKTGRIQPVWNKVRVKGHVDAALQAAQSL